MAKKYRVCADEQFLGHYHAADGFSAIEKAIKVNFIYHPDIIGNEDCIFTARKEMLEGEYSYTWRNFPWLVEEFEIPIKEKDVA